jgi:hypothetical protein
MDWSAGYWDYSGWLWKYEKSPLISAKCCIARPDPTSQDPGDATHEIIGVGCGIIFWIGDGGQEALGIIGEGGRSGICYDRG